MTPAPTSACRQEMRDWTQRDRRITTICRTENGNISVATNQGALAARGEFIVFVDHDDLLDHDALAHLRIISMPIPRPNWSTVTMTRSGRMACIIPLNSSRAGHLSYFYRSVTLPIYRRWRAASFAPLVGFESGLKGRRIMTFGCGQVNGPRALGTLPKCFTTGESCPDRRRLTARANRAVSRRAAGLSKRRSTGAEFPAEWNRPDGPNAPRVPSSNQ